MTQEEIVDYNKRCAEFLGFKYHEGSEYWTTLLWGGNGFTLRQMRFHLDWNWIMEVVEAIEKLNSSKFYVSIVENECEIIDKKAASNEENPFMIKLIASYTESESKKEAVVQAINKFLIWYNNEQRT